MPLMLLSNDIATFRSTSNNAESLRATQESARIDHCQQSSAAWRIVCVGRRGNLDEVRARSRQTSRNRQQQEEHLEDIAVADHDIAGRTLVV
jgi:predicted RNA polymerase sigma factor